MKTTDFLDNLKHNIESILPSPLELHAQGDRVRKATHALLYSADAQILYDASARAKDGYTVDLAKREIRGVTPVCLAELYMLALSITLLYKKNPTYKDSREIAESLLCFEDYDMADIILIANKIEALGSD